MIKMNCVILTACIVLVAFCSCGEYKGGISCCNVMTAAEEIMKKTSEKETETIDIGLSFCC